MEDRLVLCNKKPAKDLLLIDNSADLLLTGNSAMILGTVLPIDGGLMTQCNKKPVKNLLLTDNFAMISGIVLPVDGCLTGTV